MHLLGQSGVVRWHNKRFWAERGLVRCEDAADNSYTVTSVKSMLHRVKAVHDMVGRLQADEDYRRRYPDTILHQQTLVESMLDVCRLAQEQGMPDDPSAKHALINSQPTSVSVNGRMAEVVRSVRNVPSFSD